MATGLEILGGVAAAVQLTQLMANFIKNFGTIQNTPRQVKRLEGILDDLDDAHLIQAASLKERKRLWGLVLVAEQTLQRSMNEPPNRLLQFFWPEESEKRLKDQVDELQYELITLGLRVDRRRWATYLSHHPLPGFPTAPHSPGGISPGGTTPPPPAYLDIQAQAASPSSSHQPAQNETPPGASASLAGRHKLPATLYLQNGAGIKVAGPLEVKYLQVLERDAETRLIHYERKTDNHQVSVTHRIPRGCIRFEDDSLTDTEVHFLGAHPITVFRKGTGHEVYFRHAKYKFTDLVQREKFLEHMLERTLLRRFYSEEIRYNGQLHAQGKVIRLWKKKEDTRSGQPREAVKMTYLAREERPVEWDLGCLSRHVLIGEGGWVTLKECDADGLIKDEAATIAIKFRVPEGDAKKRQRRPSSTVIASPELSAQAGDADPGPEAKKSRRSSTWRRLSRSGMTAKGKKSTECLPENSMSKPAGKLVDLEFVDSNDGELLGAASDVKSDAEVFKEVFQENHPHKSSQFTPLPPIAPVPALDPGDLRRIELDLGAPLVWNGGYE
ncbi:hypothetical protein B0T14DRAFT_567807 [Immersiella caudata]|uniref:Uncharacterized protein n=1 Tax=Immersiella caudata TaxID=314043 RepID=A0AA39WIV3_9PEZI|nr:hypothetical protein B0T14DRAFT_567807 [Immersiella caudata]